MLRTYKIEEIGKYGVIYLLTSPSGKHYVGQSWNIKQRWGHYKNLHAKCQTKLYRSLLKYGPENFKYEIIDLCENQNEMDEKEITYIKLYDSVSFGYNLKYGGSKGKHSPETKNKIKMSLSSEINKIKMSKLHSGKGNPNYGKKHSLETKIKISQNKKNNSNLIKYKYLYILSHDENGTFQVKHLNKFCESIGIKSSYMRDVIYGNMTSYKGWTAKRTLLTIENNNLAQDDSLFKN